MRIGFKNEVTIRELSGGSLLARTENLVTAGGEQLLARRLKGGGSGGASSASPVGYLALGSGGGAAARTDAALQEEVYRDALTGASTNEQGTAVLSLVVTSAQGNGAYIREAGLFNQESGGTLFARAVFSEAEQFQKVEGLAIEVTWTISVFDIA